MKVVHCDRKSCDASEVVPVGIINPKGWNDVTFRSPGRVVPAFTLCPTCSNKFGILSLPVSNSASDNVYEALAEIVEEIIENRD